MSNLRKSDGTERRPVRLGLIVGSTRVGRFADAPALWIQQAAAERGDLTLEILDLRDAALPFVNEPAPPALSQGLFTQPEARAWCSRLAPLDGFVMTVAEYNHGPTAVLKNALDSAHNEWKRKPVAFVGYGGLGGVRAIEQLRLITNSLEMVPIRQEITIGIEPFLGVSRHGKSLDEYPHLVQARGAMFDHLVWWASALRAAREEIQPPGLKA